MVVWCVRAWDKLGTCRGIGMAVGPIPVTDTIEWCKFHRFDYELSMLIMDVIAKLDSDRAEAEAAKRRLEALSGARGQA
jgi:hypothetical protein